MHWRLARLRLGRLAAVCAVIILCAPGTWLRSDPLTRLSEDITLRPIAPPAATAQPQWQVEGVWQLSSARGGKFGGYSALLAHDDRRLQTFADRGYRLSFLDPAHGPDPATGGGSAWSTHAAEQRNPSAAMAEDLWDIEAATHDPATGKYWLAYEYVHTIQRFTAAGEPDGLRALGPAFEWPINRGLEAMVRLADGRFLAIPEGRAEALIFDDDPVEGGVPQRISFASPAPDYAVTDMTQLDDGRIVLLMRKVAWGFPPFSTLLAIGDPPQMDTNGGSGAWSAHITLRLDGVVPRENYEGMAARGLDDGRYQIWLISDDNIAAIERTLLVKLILDPALEPAAQSAN